MHDFKFFIFLLHILATSEGFLVSRYVYLPHIAGLALLHRNHTPMAFRHQLRSQPSQGCEQIILCDDVILLQKQNRIVLNGVSYSEQIWEMKSAIKRRNLAAGEAANTDIASLFSYRNGFAGWPSYMSIKFRQHNRRLSSIPGMQQIQPLRTYAACQVTERTIWILRWNVWYGWSKETFVSTQMEHIHFLFSRTVKNSQDWKVSSLWSWFKLWCP